MVRGLKKKISKRDRNIDSEEIWEIKEKLEIWRTEENYTPMQCLHRAVQLDDTAITKYLVDKENLNVNIEDNNGYTPIYFATLSNLKFLIDRKASLNTIGLDGVTPLIFHLQHRNNDVEAVKVLITNGADVNVLYRNIYSNTIITPMHFLFRLSTCNLNFVPLVDLAIDMGGNVNASDDVMHMALSSQSTYIGFHRMWRLIDKRKFFYKYNVFSTFFNINQILSITSVIRCYKVMVRSKYFNIGKQEYKRSLPQFYVTLENELTKHRAGRHLVFKHIRFFLKYIPISLKEVEKLSALYGMEIIETILRNGTLHPRIDVANPLIAKMLLNDDIQFVNFDSNFLQLYLEYFKYYKKIDFKLNRENELEYLIHFSKNEEIPSLLQIARDRIRSELYRKYNDGFGLYKALEIENNHDSDGLNALKLPNSMIDLILLRKPLYVK